MKKLFEPDSRQNKAESWTYDPVGNIQTKTDFQGDLTTYQYDSANRMTAETNPAYLQVSYHYDDAGRLLDRILSNGAKTHYGWDSGGRLTQLQNTSSTGQTVNNTTYTRDRIGNILTDSNSIGATTTAYSYDPEYRLLSADYTGTANDEAYSYDKVGNRKISTKGALIPIASSRYYNYNAGNRMTDIRTGSATGTVYESYGYDDNGSMTGITGNRTMTLTWDANNKVKQINTNTFTYDPVGYRIKKAGSTNNNYYLQGEHLEAIYDNTGTVQAKYLRGGVIDEIVNGYQLDANSKLVNYTYHHDALQSVLGQSGHEGSILATQSYSAFGAILSQSGTSNNAQKYTGREIDSETGFYYYRARYYDPVRGDFISEDPKGFDAGVNFYAYCLNNPVNCNDPSGLTSLFDYINAGIRVINKGLDVHPVTGIAFNNGFPDFSSVAIKTVQLSNLTGNRSIDARLANAALDFKQTPAGYAWHHVENGTTMQLVPAGIHDATAHTGGAAWLKAGGIAAGTAAAGDAAADEGFLGLTWNNVGNGIKNILTDPSTYLWWLNSGDAGAGSDIVPRNSGSGAMGGFVIYPNKSNTNQMRSVYSK